MLLDAWVVYILAILVPVGTWAAIEGICDFLEGGV